MITLTVSAFGCRRSGWIEKGRREIRGRRAETPLGTRIAAGTVHLDIGKNGRFLIPTQTERAASGPMNVVVNWTAGLKK
jgi:hypothetical protein